MVMISVAVAAIAAVLLLPTISDVLSLVLPRARRRADAALEPLPPPALLFLIPAHDEELLIGECLASLRTLAYPATRVAITVIADNCTDRTCQIARGTGAHCLERTDTRYRGKPWAIAWALERLPVDRYDAVVILDADARVQPGFAAQLATHRPLVDKAVQPYNGVYNRRENALTRLASLFATMRFQVMNTVKQRAELNVPLANGLCIGTGVLRAHGWQAFSICEDWELYATLTTAGVPIENAPGARVASQEARSLSQSSSQRRRWSAGRIAVLRHRTPALLRSRQIGFHQKLDVLAELSAPGPVAHTGAAVVLAVLALVLHVPGAPWLVLALAISTVRYVAYTLVALRLEPEAGRAVLAFSFLPVYAVWRLGLQLVTFVLPGTRAWVRTERHVGRGTQQRDDAPHADGHLVHSADQPPPRHATR